MADTNNTQPTEIDARRNADDEDTGRGMDPELKALSAILRVLDKQSDDAAARIVDYIHARFVASHVR